MKKGIIILTILGLCLATIGAQGTQENEGSKQQKDNASVVTVKLSIPDPENSSVGSFAKKFAELSSEKTNGKVNVEVYADGVLFGGDQNAAINMLEDGGLDSVILSTSVFASFQPKMNAISLPYLFSNYDEFINYLNGEPGQELLNSLQFMNIEGLALGIRTFRIITNSRNPIYTPDDMLGLKLRVPNNKLWVIFFKELGADPTPMNFKEVYTALQLTTIDGQENPAEVPYSNNFFEVQKYVSRTNHIADSFGIFFNHDVWSQFDAQTQAELKEAAKEAAAFKNETDIAQEQVILEKLQENGMEVNSLTPEQVKVFQDIATNLYPKFADMIGEDFINTSMNFLGR